MEARGWGCGQIWGDTREVCSFTEEVAFVWRVSNQKEFVSLESAQQAEGIACTQEACDRVTPLGSCSRREGMCPRLANCGQSWGACACAGHMPEGDQAC